MVGGLTMMPSGDNRLKVHTTYDEVVAHRHFR